MRLADNHIGWEVQAHDKILGWHCVAGPFVTQDEARIEMKKAPIEFDYRVVEALKEREEK